MTTKPSRLTREIVEMAEAQRRLGMIDDAAVRKITAKTLGKEPLPTEMPMSAAEVRAVREQVRLSQAAFGRYLNVTPGYVSQLERGEAHAKGPALALLNVIRRHGLEVLQ